MLLPDWCLLEVCREVLHFIFSMAFASVGDEVIELYDFDDSSLHSDPLAPPIEEDGWDSRQPAPSYIGRLAQALGLSSRRRKGRFGISDVSVRGSQRINLRRTTRLRRFVVLRWLKRVLLATPVLFILLWYVCKLSYAPVAYVG
jgi:hypothetical protein